MVIKKEDFQHYYTEHKHNKRFASNFWMFAVIAIALGLMLGLTIHNTTTGNSIFNVFTTSSTGSGGGAAIATNGTNQTTVSYQGVLDMLNKCVPIGAGVNMTCNLACSRVGRTCVAAYIERDGKIATNERCRYKNNASSSDLLQCTCCYAPGNNSTIQQEGGGEGQSCEESMISNPYPSPQSCRNDCTTTHCNEKCGHVHGWCLAHVSNECNDIVPTCTCNCYTTMPNNYGD